MFTLVASLKEELSVPGNVRDFPAFFFLLQQLFFHYPVLLLMFFSI
jgi:hypothetical protein